MRAWLTSTQSLTPISWPTYLCISLGWANSRFAISDLDLSFFPVCEGYHKPVRRAFYKLTVAPLKPLSRAVCSDRVPFVSSPASSHLASYKYAQERNYYGYEIAPCVRATHSTKP